MPGKKSTPQSIAERQVRALENKLLAVSPMETQIARRALEVFISQMKTPELAACTAKSLLLAAYHVAKLGLNPDPQLGYVWIIPFGKEATVVPGYQGMLELARRSGDVCHPTARILYRRDTFTYHESEAGQHWSYEPAWVRGAMKGTCTERGEMIGAFVAWEDSGGRRHVFPIDKETLDRRRRASKMANAGAWVDYEDAMYLAKAVKEAARFWRTNPELATAVQLDTSADLGAPQASSADMIELLGEDEDLDLPDGKEAGSEPDQG